jgi:hypothetical protein
MQEDKTCQEQEPSVGVGGEGQSEGAGQVKGQYRAYPLIVYGKMFFLAQRRVICCEKRAAPHSTWFFPVTPPPQWYGSPRGMVLHGVSTIYAAPPTRFLYMLTISLLYWTNA